MCEQRYKMMVLKFDEMRTQVSHAISEIGSSSVPKNSPIVKAAEEVDQPKLTPVKRRRATVPRSSPPHSSKKKEPKSNESEEEGDTKGKRKAIEVPEEQKLTPQKKHFAAVSRRSPRIMQMKNLSGENVVRAANNAPISEASREQVVSQLGGTQTKVEPPHLKEERTPEKLIEVETGGVIVVKEHARTKMKSRQQPARKLIMQRTTRFAAEKRKELSNSMKMFSMLVDKCLGDGYMVEHDAEIFGFATKSIFNKDVCSLVINFEQVNNSVVEIWSRHLYEKMLQDGGNMPVQFGTSAAVPVPLKLSDESITRRSRYIADLLGVGLLGQITLIPYNT
ncbi:unnamed protein product [Cuscuta epithymum]|uniref:Uncharacterized protein n=1 Tax=Cuscuta epithymum TaxID=186058 RepID=A0AAV0GGT2_9ASTE|nr:unnamed protein product [Cuscuta epithymum]